MRGNDKNIYMDGIYSPYIPDVQYTVIIDIVMAKITHVKTKCKCHYYFKKGGTVGIKR